MSKDTVHIGGAGPRSLAATLSPEQIALLKRRLKRKQEAERDRRIQRRGLTMAPLSFAQELLWLVDQLSPDKVNYTVPRLIRLKGPFDVEAMERTLTTIVARHEVLRTAIRVVGGVPMQHVEPARPVSIARIDLSGEPADQREPRALAIVRDLIRRPFDFSKDVLMRPTVIRLDAEDHVFVLESHHIASDGWSKDVLFTELNALYAAYCEGREPELPELPIQYSDYAVWQREVLTETFLKDELAFWKKQLAGAPPVLEFPSARQRPAAQSFEGRGQRFHFPKPLLDAAQQFSRDEGVTLFMTLLAAFNAFVCRYTGQPDFVIGTPIAGRTRPEQEPLIGYFTNTLAL
ncbi:MAG TPA: condensation domain-containing protein, partial [Vicinamibacterales bacterium]|nr:condensation domain-containing protein [Vicinamibacterales bacterium]